MSTILDNFGIVKMSGSVQHRRATSYEWEASMYVPAEGEICVTTDTGETRIGNGVDVWTDLPNPYSNIGVNDGLENADFNILGFDFGEVTE